MDATIAALLRHRIGLRDRRSARSFTKRLIFSGWALVPKVVSALVSFEAERRAYAARSHSYTTEYGRRGGQRLTFRTRTRGPREPARPKALVALQR